MSRSQTLDSWRERIARLPNRVARLFDEGPALSGGELLRHDHVITTGLGSSAAHARLPAHLLAESHGAAARFAPVGGLHRPAPSDCAARDKADERPRGADTICVYWHRRMQCLDTPHMCSQLS